MAQKSIKVCLSESNDFYLVRLCYRVNNMQIGEKKECPSSCTRIPTSISREEVHSLVAKFKYKSVNYGM